MKLAIASLAITSASLVYAFGQTGHELVDKMHAYYVSQFEDLKLTEMGLFGTSRIEWSKIKNHSREGGDPGYNNKEWWNAVSIYGNHGKPLGEKLEQRYSRSSNRAINPEPRVSLSNADLQKALAAFRRKSNFGDWYAIQNGGVFLEIRPIRLTKKECLSCHTDMKLKDPVALMVYSVAPMPSK